MAVWICWNFTKPSPATNSSVTVNIAIIRFAICSTSTLKLPTPNSQLPTPNSQPPFLVWELGIGGWASSPSLPDIQQHAPVHPVPVPRLLPEEGRRVVLRLD